MLDCPKVYSPCTACRNTASVGAGSLTMWRQNS